jgi:cytochrome P450
MATALYPPGPQSRLPYGNLIAMRRDTLRFLQRLAAEYGDIVHFKVGSRDYYLLNDPESIRAVLVTDARSFAKGRGLEVSKRLLGNGLLTSEGEFHRRQRRLVQPAFHRQRIAGYGETMVCYADQTRARWQDGMTVDIAAEMMRLTLRIVGKTLFDSDVAAEAEEIGRATIAAMGLVNWAMLPFADRLERFAFPITRRFQRARSRLDAVIYRMIAEHRAGGVDRGDLLSMLLFSQDEEGDGASMTDAQVRDEAMTLFLAGHETTANALTWTWYLLAQYPEIEAKLQAELEAVLTGRLPTGDDVPELPYTRMVLAESMRLYPPAWAIGRRVLTDYPLGDYVLPAGSICLLSPYVTHHDARWFPDPFRFDPERWTPEAQAARPRFSYYPFGSGPRVCIGESFAWMEGILLLATLAQQWTMRPVPGHPVVPKPLITLRPKYGIRMRLQRREIA